MARWRHELHLRTEMGEAHECRELSWARQLAASHDSAQRFWMLIQGAVEQQLRLRLQRGRVGISLLRWARPYRPEYGRTHSAQHGRTVPEFPAGNLLVAFERRRSRGQHSELLVRRWGTGRHE